MNRCIRLLADTCVLQLLVALNRAVRAAPEEADPASYRFDPKMEEVTRYILAHLGEELSIFSAIFCHFHSLGLFPYAARKARRKTE